jgi:hypothetical protein
MKNNENVSKYYHRIFKFWQKAKISLKDRIETFLIIVKSKISSSLMRKEFNKFEDLLKIARRIKIRRKNVVHIFSKKDNRFEKIVSKNQNQIQSRINSSQSRSKLISLRTRRARRWISSITSMKNSNLLTKNSTIKSTNDLTKKEILSSLHLRIKEDCLNKKNVDCVENQIIVITTLFVLILIERKIWTNSTSHHHDSRQFNRKFFSNSNRKKNNLWS